MNETRASLDFLKRKNYICEVVEQKLRHSVNKKDLFNIFDILAINPNKLITLGVQTTSYSNTSARIKKIINSDKTLPWLKTGNSIQVHGWKDEDNMRCVDIYLENNEIKYRNIES